MFGHGLFEVLPVVEVIQDVTELAHQLTLVQDQVVLIFFENLSSLLWQRILRRIKLVHKLSSGVIRFRVLRAFAHHIVFLLELVQAVGADHPDEGASDGPVFLQPFQESGIILVIFQLLFFVLHLGLSHIGIIDQVGFTLSLNNRILVIYEVLDHIVIGNFNLVIWCIQLLE